MPPSVSLGTYQLFVKARGDKQVLSDIPPHGFLPWCNTLLSQPGLRGIHDDSGARHESAPPRMDGTHTLYGVVHSGDSGFGSRFVHAQTGAPTFVRRPRDAELIPFYYQFYAPRGWPLAILVLQKFGHRSPYTFFKDELRRAFNDAHPGLSLQMQPYIAKDVLQRMEEGIVTEVNFTKFRAPSDINSFVRNHGLTEDDVYFETRIVARKGRAINIGRQLKRLVAGLSSRNAVEAPEAWRGYGDEIRVKLKHGGKDRTLSFGAGREVNPYEDVTDRIERTRDQHPRIDSLHPVANELVRSIREEMRLHHVD